MSEKELKDKTDHLIEKLHTDWYKSMTISEAKQKFINEIPSDVKSCFKIQWFELEPLFVESVEYNEGDRMP